LAKETKDKPVSANPALVEFPRDEWGMTSELRKAGIRAAQSVRGNPEKQALFVATLRILAQHSAARVNSDADAVKARVRKLAERDASPLSRMVVTGVPTPDAPAEPVEAA